jgi:hypothetical protein
MTHPAIWDGLGEGQDRLRIEHVTEAEHGQQPA